MKRMLFLLTFIGLGLNLNSHAQGDYYLSSYQQNLEYDEDAVTYLTATGIPDDGTVYYASTPQEITGHEMWVAYSNHVKRLKFYGIYNKFVIIYPFLGSTITTQRYNAVTPTTNTSDYRSSDSGTINRSGLGMQSSGGTAHVKTNLYLNEVLQDDYYFSIYSQTNASENSSDFGGRGSTSKIALSTSWTGDFRAFSANSTDNRITATNTDSRGYYSLHRTSSTVFKAYKNGSQIGSTNTFTSVTTNQAYNIYIGANNNANATQEVSTRIYSYFAYGVGLTDAEVALDYASVQQLQIDLHREQNLWWMLLLIPTLLKGRVIKLNEDDNYKIAA